MAAPMKRGANVALTREIPHLTGVVLGVRFAAGAEQVLLDNLVVAALLCDEHSKVLSDEHFVFFNQLSSPDVSVSHLERLVGNDTEQVEVDLGAVPEDVDRIVLIGYVNEGMGVRRSLGQLRDCTVRVLNLADETELVRSENLAPGFSTETAVALGELYRHDGHWKFKVIGLGYADGIRAVARDYGVHL